MHNLILLENICMQKNAECMAHITFTLNKLTTQPAITKIDSVGNEQLYQIGKITISWKLNLSQSNRF